MQYKPKYDQTLIIGIVKDGIWCWYVTGKDMWIVTSEQHGEEYSVECIGQRGEGSFLEKMKPFYVQTEELADLLHEKNYESILDLVPALRIDLDHKTLQSLVLESSTFEKNVPKGWTGEYRDFIDDVPKQNQYWMINGQNEFLDKSHQ
ncbi:hypothetical protein [Priestia koreensis]|uniref:hypothetical protein n=1 Tax=Priestia koreensis TaxID=284581 RepID=UPI00203E12A6|nr:hypothetical protein [Priestia koreensis]MCM3004316.1 hypothetical protein [Priestia koreensis]